MKKPSLASRREFLRQSAAFSALGAAAPFAMNLAAMGAAAAADNPQDYRALVCIFLTGGNDAFNTVLATDTASWTNYSAVRNQRPESLALLRDVASVGNATPGSPAWLGGVLPIAPATTQGRAYALHPALTGVRNMFASRRLAIVSNVGPLVEPMTKDEYVRKLKRRPMKLFSHNDQQNTWQTFAPEGTTTGWGGRMADMIASSQNSLFTSVSTAGNAPWTAGRSIRPYQLGLAGAYQAGFSLNAQGQEQVYGFPGLATAMQRVMQTPSNGHVLASDLGAVTSRSINAEKSLRNLLPSASVPPFGPDSALTYTSISGANTVNPLAQQLQIVARTIAARNSLGLSRQVFFVSLPGFDTHDSQNRNHTELMLRLNHGLQYFNNALTALGMADQVTTFTASDFGRTFTSNGDGTDHGWGGHHFVMGGAVAGGEIYGQFPVLGTKNTYNNDFDSSPDQITNGALLPKLSVDQYGATLARWFGLGDSQLRDVFPNLGNFSDRPNLGFMV